MSLARHFVLLRVAVACIGLLGAGATAAAEMAHLGGGEGKAVLAGAGEDWRQRGARPDGHRLVAVGLTRQQHMRQATPCRVDGHDDA